MKTKKEATKKKGVKKAATAGGKRGRVAALAGKCFFRTKKEANVREKGKARGHFDLLAKSDGISFEKYVDKGGSIPYLNYFVKEGFFVARNTAKAAA